MRVDMAKVDRDQRYHPLYAYGRDAGRVKDPALAKLGADLCERTLAWIIARRKGEAAVAPDFQDAVTLTLSRLVSSVAAGAACAGFLTKDNPQRTALLVDLFGRARARARVLMLRLSTEGREDDASLRLAELGLADRSGDVRVEAAACVQGWGARELLPTLEAAWRRETDAWNRSFMTRSQSIAAQGYWLGEPDERGMRPYEMSDLSGRGGCLIGGDVPAIAFNSLSEREVMGRVREADADGDSEAAKWLGQMDEERQRRLEKA